MNKKNSQVENKAKEEEIKNKQNSKDEKEQHPAQEQSDESPQDKFEGLSNAEQKLKEKLDQTEEKLEQVSTENEKLNDKFTRLAAEFNNYKKRMQKEEQQRLKYEGKTILKELLPVFDDIDRAVEHQDSEQQQDQQSTDKSDDGGLKMIYKKLHKILNDLGVVKYEAIGEEFDPDLHHAIMTRESDEHDEDIVLEEIEKGYKYKDKVLRYSKVIVSK